ncbi:FCD domain-containing protein [Actinomadura rayongensis]|uniref:FCD domain-containing protein n=1 Tax=Actinomadura rayongensis TaxID=1429076 RepID=A0A6I4WGQ7_9ACTN|nr:FCD domain-containing protein [Actinomadura rayongensis]
MTTGERDSLRDRAYRTLRERIIEGGLRPGERLVERDLAADLGVSRIPLREALRLLAAEGLVVLVPRRGALVSPFTPADVRDLFDVRQSLEVLAARLAAERADAAGRARLRLRLADNRAALRTGDRAAISAANAAFHAEVLELCGNALLTLVVRPLDARMQWLFRLTADLDEDQDAQCAEHGGLYDAIAAGDAALAADLAERHVLRNRDVTLRLAESWSVPAADPLQITHTRRRRPAG